MFWFVQSKAALPIFCNWGARYGLGPVVCWLLVLLVCMVSPPPPPPPGISEPPHPDGKPVAILDALKAERLCNVLPSATARGPQANAAPLAGLGFDLRHEHAHPLADAASTDD